MLTRVAPDAQSIHGGDGLEAGTSMLRAALRVPTVAWPTLALLAGSLALWMLVLWGHAAGLIGWLAGCVLCTLAFHGLFTVMHDASHQALSRYRWVNEVVGRLCGSAFLRAFVGFRFIHQQHHKHTNDDAHDPDTWSGKGPAWLLPLRWATQDVIYRRYYKEHWHTRPLSERAELIALSVLEYGALIGLIASGLGMQALVFWVLPAKLTLTLLAFTFDYLPHRPHRVSAAEDRYRTTSVRPGIGWALVTFHQNLHGVHHLYPAAPFYRYGRIWRLRGEHLMARGMPVRGVAAAEGMDALKGAQLSPMSIS